MEEIGEVFSYYSNIGVAAIKLTGDLDVGDKIRIKGHTTDFEQEIKSIQIEHEKVVSASAGDDIGIKVNERVRKHDKVYKIK